MRASTARSIADGRLDTRHTVSGVCMHGRRAAHPSSTDTPPTPPLHAMPGLLMPMLSTALLVVAVFSRWVVIGWTRGRQNHSAARAFLGR